MPDLLDLQLTEGPFPTILLLLAGLALALTLLLLWRRPLAAGIALVVTVGIAFAANPLAVNVAGLFPEPLPLEVLLWGAVGVAGVALGIAAATRAGILKALTALGCGVLVLLAGAGEVNGYYARFVTLGDLVGGPPDVAALPDLLPAPAPATPTTPGRPAPVDDPARSGFEKTPVVDRWKGGARGKGGISTARIPGTISGFPARDGYVWLPPAYSPTGPRLPVMVVVAGQPGGPADWLTAGRLVSQMDRFAAAHNGLAPVTVVVDPTGSAFANTLCLDSAVGKAETYLAKDVPEWITGRLRVDTNPAHWTFAGFSFGGTCAVQLATRAPDRYGSFIDLQGEQEPTLGPDRGKTVQQLFGGDKAAFESVLPMTQLTTRRYPESWAYFASGAKDGQFMAYMNAVADAAAKAGMKVQRVSVPNQGHSWNVAVAQLVPGLEWLSPRLGFTR
ncbi:hypothetical protein GCM10009836_50910 [Pseudonocardia ailaonensis]|uniref:Esterase n=1 Tax=Pseudonocardia ailaonensis TaxID=367279 RepID=A0ABN2NES9_9PSEU